MPDRKAASTAGNRAAAAATPPVDAADAPAATVLVKPTAGDAVTVPVIPGQTLQLAFDPAKAIAQMENGDLTLSFADGARLTLTGFAAAAQSDTPPHLLLPGGVIVAGDVLVVHMVDLPAAATLETAATTLPPSGGVHAYGDDLGDVIGGLPPQGVLPPTGLRFPEMQPTEGGRAGAEEAAAAAGGQPPSPPPPPPPVDDAGGILTADLVTTVSGEGLPPGAVFGSFHGGFEDSQPNQHVGDLSIRTMHVDLQFVPNDNEVPTKLTVSGIPAGAQLNLGGVPVAVAGGVAVIADAATLAALFDGSQALHLSLAGSSWADLDTDFPLHYSLEIQDPENGGATVVTTGTAVIDAVADLPAITGQGASVFGSQGYAYAIGGAEKGDGGPGGHVSTLYRIDLASGEARAVGPVAVDGSNNLDVEALTLGSDGRLYAIASTIGQTRGLLVLDPADGHTIAWYDGAGHDGGADGIGDLHVDPSGLAEANGELYLTVKEGNASALYQVDLDDGTGSATVTRLGDAGRGNVFGALTTDSDGGLVAIADDGSALYQVSAVDGSVLAAHDLSGFPANANIEGLDFDSAGTLWALDRLSGGLYRIDTADWDAQLQSQTLDVNDQTGDGFEAMAIAPGVQAEVTLDLSGHFGDYLDSSEDHYFLVRVPEEWSAPQGATVVSLDGDDVPGVPAGDYIRVDADDLIDPSSGEASTSVSLLPPAEIDGTTQIPVYAVAAELVAPGDTGNAELTFANNVAAGQVTFHVPSGGEDSFTFDLSDDGATHVVVGFDGDSHGLVFDNVVDGAGDGLGLDDLEAHVSSFTHDVATGIATVEFADGPTIVFDGIDDPVSSLTDIINDPNSQIELRGGTT
jgi:hypothetical protein